MNDTKGFKIFSSTFFTQPPIIYHFLILQGQEGRSLQDRKRGEGNSSKVNDTKGLNLFSSKKVPPFYPASHSIPFHNTEGRKKVAGQKMGKGNSSKVNDSEGLNLFSYFSFSIIISLTLQGQEKRRLQGRKWEKVILAIPGGCVPPSS